MFTFVDNDPYLETYRDIILNRREKLLEKKNEILRGGISLPEFASGHEYFGLHFREDHWIFREWAPNATHIYIIGDMTSWTEQKEFSLTRIGEEGVWEIRLPSAMINHGNLYRLKIHWKDGCGDRIPAYARRVVQDPSTLIFNAQVWRPEKPHEWTNHRYVRPEEPPIIYEAHVGMAQEREKVGTFGEFTKYVLPRIARAGYNTLQLMAVQEHPYYASFGYQVSSFFAPSFRFGTPEELKELVDAAHGLGIAVVMDMVHSHSVLNEVEGLSLFDGTGYQYFHEGVRGFHDAWNSRCFDYAKPQVLHFLLSNCRFWLDEYRFDGFRFDGVTSMIYHHRGMGKAFTTYGDYFDETVDEDALVYLTLANRLIHHLRPDAVTIAEDVSGMPGLAVPASDGGVGFDYRFAMGIPDYWIRLVKDIPDEDWSMEHLWYELNNRRKDEKTISYAESHDQALVGDQTLIWRVIGSAMYDHMSVQDDDFRVNRGVSLHKMIRLITLATAGNGYLNFMGNEFGHPEWIDFPRPGNDWSYRYARRQWRLADDTGLKYHFLAEFDRDMIRLARESGFLKNSEARLIMVNSGEKTLVFMRKNLLFAFNFHHERSYANYRVGAPPGKYRLIMDTDDRKYAGHGRLTPGQEHLTLYGRTGKKEYHWLSIYLPARSALVLRFENGSS